jgi:hypothetical protein
VDLLLEQVSEEPPWEDLQEQVLEPDLLVLE